MEKKLKEMIGKYSYGKTDLATKDFQIRYDKFTRQLEIPNFYDHSGNTMVGTCSELARSSQKEINRMFPDLNVYSFMGTEPQFFNNRSWMGNDTHLANLVLKDDLMKDDKVWNRKGDSDKIQMLEDAGALIVDPTYGKVIPLKDSGYVVDQVISYIPFNNTLSTGHLENLIPLGFTENGDLVSMFADFDTEEILCLRVRDSNEVKNVYGLYSLNLNKDMKEFGDVAKSIDALRRKTPMNAEIMNPKKSLLDFLF